MSPSPLTWLAFGMLVSLPVLAQDLPEKSRPTGLRPPTAEEWNWMQRNMTKTVAVRLNQLALDRLNLEREKQGLAKMSLEPARLGEEVIPRTGLQKAGPGGPLPTEVDNSLLPSFPPVRDQGQIGSCASFSTTYYVGTHMLGLARGWNNRNEDNTRKLSPKWTYPMVNDGQDNGSWFTPTIDVLLKHGGATWAEFPYSGANTASSYREWSRSAAVWRNAINYRMAQSGVVENLNTAAGRDNLKALLANGYICLYATDINGWQFTTFSDDPSTVADNAVVGKPVCSYMINQASGHAMTVVGYNDNVWVDINKNGAVDAGEKGAFKIVNSWGADWKDGGFAWIAYDALPATSQVSDVTGQNNRKAAWWYYQSWWFTARPAYTPTLLAQFTVSHRYRAEMQVALGKASVGATTPSTTWTPAALQYQGGNFAFDGGSSEGSGSFVFDFSDLATNGNLRYFLVVTDKASQDAASITDFRLTDAAGNTLGAAASGLPGTADNSTFRAFIDHSLSTGTITSANTATGQVGVAFNFQVTAIITANSFGAVGLPPGLTINASSGAISGTPSQTGSFSVSLSASGPGGSASGTLALTIRPAAGLAPVIYSSGSVTGAVGTVFFYSILASNSPTSFAANNLPTGLGVDTGNGQISGTPSQAGTYQAQMTAANGAGSTTRALTIVIKPPAAGVPVITSPLTASVNVGSPFTYRITANNNPTLFGADNLPPELTIDGVTGTISGIFSVARDYTIALRAVNATGTGYASLFLTVLGDSSFGPPNDNFLNRSTLSGNSLSITSANVNATFETGEPAHAGFSASKSVWWTWAAPANGQATLSTVGSSFDTLLAVYTGTAISALNPIASDDESGGDHTSHLTFNASAGTVYQIAVDGYYGAAGSLVLSLFFTGSTVAPPNDHFLSSAALSGTNTSLTAKNIGATAQAGEPAHAGFTASKSVWWTWTAPQSGLVTLDTIGSDFDTVLAVYTGSAVNALTPIAGDDETGGNNTSLLTFNASAGVTYRIAVDGYLGAAGNISLRLVLGGVSASNDLFANRQTITGTNATLAGVSLSATVEPGEPYHDGYAPRKSLWWTWTAPRSSPVVVDTIGSDFDTVLAIYTGTSFGFLTPVASDDDSGGNRTSRAEFVASAGQTYQIAVDGYDGESGNVVLHLRTGASAPGNDRFANRFALPGSPFLTNGVNVGATAQPTEGYHFGYPPARSVWWSWVAPRSGEVFVSTEGSAFDTVLAVYAGDSVDALFEVAANDDEDFLITSAVTFYAVAGTEYHIVVDGYDGEAGNIVLSGGLVEGSDTVYYEDFEYFYYGTNGFLVSADWFGNAISGGSAGIFYDFFYDTLFGYIGNIAPSAAVDYLYAFRPLNFNPVAEGRPLAGFFSYVKIVDSSNGEYDSFGVSFYNQPGDLLARIVFDNGTLDVLYQNGTNQWANTGVKFANDEWYELSIYIDFQRNRWSADLGGMQLFDEIPFNTADRELSLGDVDFEWFIYDVDNPGDNYLAFDDLLLIAIGEPTITQQPRPATAAVGTVASFLAGATGSNPLQYQWYFQGAPVPGATNAALTLLNVGTNQAGGYHFVVANAYGAVTSQVATLTVLPPTSTTVLGKPVMTGRGLQFQVTGVPGRTYRLEATTNFVQWFEISTVVNQQGTVQLLDPAVDSSPRKFYRIRESY